MPNVETNDKINFPNVLLIAGQQQNVGKTTLACNIISQFTWSHKITGIKITPHFHKNTGEALVIEKTPHYQILKETTPDTAKDTSLMLRAGAEEAYLLQTNSECLIKGFNQVLKYIPENNLIVCESAKIFELINPGLFLVLRQPDYEVTSIDDEEMFNSANRIITFTADGFDFSIDELIVGSEGWKIKDKIE